MKNNRSSTLVYSTDPTTRLPQDVPPQTPAAPLAGRATVRLSYETKGRKGKGVTVLRDAPLAAVDLMALGKTLRAACGSGGTVKDGVIEIQGDHRARVLAYLQTTDWLIKQVGG